MFNYASWDAACSPLPPPQIALTVAPRHGALSVRPGQFTVSQIREGAADCTGRTYPASTVWYMPAPGNRGPGRFVYSVISTRGTAHDTVIVDVR